MSLAIALMVSDNTLVPGVIAIVAVVFAVAIFGIIIYFAVVVSVTYLVMFYYDTVTDYADIILSVVTLFLSICLLVQIVFVRSKIKADEEKRRNVLLITIGLSVMAVMLAERLAIVLVANFDLTVSMGYGVYYGLATVLPEFCVSCVMIGIVLFTFVKSRSMLLSSTSTYDSSANVAASSDIPMKEPKHGRYDAFMK